MLITAQPAGDAPLPWHIPWVLMLILLPANFVESPNHVRRKNFIFSFALNIDSMAEVGTPNA